MAHAIFTASLPRRGRRRTYSYAVLGRRRLSRLAALLLAWYRRRRDRRRLQQLDARALRDLGIDRSLVDNESAVPFWRLR